MKTINYKREENRRGIKDNYDVGTVEEIRKNVLFISLKNYWIVIDTKKKVFEEGDYEG